MAISKRIFGSDIPIKVKKKLEARQLMADRTRSPNDEITSDYPDPSLGRSQHKYSEWEKNSFDGVANLSSRTPFARLWTSVTLYNTSTQKGGKINYSKIGLGSRTYVMGNHVYNNLNNANPTDPIGPPTAEEAHTAAQYDLLPPSELHKNTFMSPPAGITSVTSTTEGAVGAIKKTTVNFTVNNFTDYDKIYSRFFLKPGAQLIVDFGWDTSDLYNPYALIAKDWPYMGFGEYIPTSFNDALYGDNGLVTRAAGDMETLRGFVTNYDAKIKDNGTVECSVEITSENSALLNNDLNSNGNILARIAEELDNALLDYALKRDPKRAEHIMNSWKKSAPDLEAFEKAADDYGSTELYSKTLVPTGRAVEHGVFWVGDVTSYSGSPVRKNIFISYGVFEDFILNPEFAHGKVDITTINTDDDAIKFDSRNSFVSFNPKIIKYQKTIENSLKIDMLYPEDWDNSYNVGIGRISIDHQKLKEKDPGMSVTEFDWSVGRIPLRELFISVETIKKIIRNLESKGSVLDLLKELFIKIKADSFDLIDLKLSNNGNSSIVSPIDINTLDIETNKEEEDNNFAKLFTFKPNSPNSIVKTFDVSFSMPTGNYGNMIAIQSISAGNSKTIFPVTQFLDDALALESFNIVSKIDTGGGESSVTERISVGYLPDIGSYRSDEMKRDIKRDNYIGFNFGDTFDGLFNVAEMDRNINKQISLDNRAGGNSTVEDNAPPDTTVTNPPKASDASKEKFYVDGEIDEGYLITETIKAFCETEVKQDISRHSIKKNSHILPFTLNLGIYGISSITPGDVFKVDYLPQRYVNTVYFQVMKVSHNLDTSGWTTNFETQFRIRKFTKIEGGLYNQILGVTLNRKILKRRKLYQIDSIIERINHLKWVDRSSANELQLDGIFSFDSNKGFLNPISFELPFWFGEDTPTGTGWLDEDGRPGTPIQIRGLNIDSYAFIKDKFSTAHMCQKCDSYKDLIYYEEGEGHIDRGDTTIEVYPVLKIIIKPILLKNLLYTIISKDEFWFLMPKSTPEDVYNFLVELLTGKLSTIMSSYSKRLEELKDMVKAAQEISGCMDPNALNYNPLATTGVDGQHIEPCFYPDLGCTDPEAENYDVDAMYDDGGCTYQEVNIYGCMDPNALNYSDIATADDGSCTYQEVNIYGCMDPNALNYSDIATADDGSCTYEELLQSGASCTDNSQCASGLCWTDATEPYCI